MQTELSVYRDIERFSESKPLAPCCVFQRVGLLRSRQVFRRAYVRAFVRGCVGACVRSLGRLRGMQRTVTGALQRDDISRT
jgi:hypothetical protein